MTVWTLLIRKGIEGGAMTDGVRIVICHRCGLEISPGAETLTLEEILAPSLNEESLQKDSCQCPSRDWSMFTSRPQPPRLDDIERRMK